MSILIDSSFSRGAVLASRVSTPAAVSAALTHRTARSGLFTNPRIDPGTAQALLDSGQSTTSERVTAAQQWQPAAASVLAKDQEAAVLRALLEKGKAADTVAAHIASCPRLYSRRTLQEAIPPIAGQLSVTTLVTLLNVIPDLPVWMRCAATALAPHSAPIDALAGWLDNGQLAPASLTWVFSAQPQLAARWLSTSSSWAVTAAVSTTDPTIIRAAARCLVSMHDEHARTGQPDLMHTVREHARTLLQQHLALPPDVVNLLSELTGTRRSADIGAAQAPGTLASLAVVAAVLPVVEPAAASRLGGIVEQRLRQRLRMGVRIDPDRSVVHAARAACTADVAGDVTLRFVDSGADLSTFDCDRGVYPIRDPWTNTVVVTEYAASDIQIARLPVGFVLRGVRPRVVDACVDWLNRQLGSDYTAWTTLFMLVDTFCGSFDELAATAKHLIAA